MTSFELFTPRLRLLALTAESAAAAIADRERFSRLLEADVPADWPPETLADVQGLMAEKLAADPGLTGWWGWYVIARPGVVADSATLIGTVGCSRWGPENRLYFGYGLLPAYFRRGLASEAALALIDWVTAQPGITRIDATTFERHEASIRILERCGFTCRGVSPDDASAADSDRQGRGRLMLYVREQRPVSADMKSAVTLS